MAIAITLRQPSNPLEVVEVGVVWNTSKLLARKAWFRPGKTRRCFIGPYAGLMYEMCPQLLHSRMSIFYRAYEPEVTSLISRIVRPGMVVLDVGAHIGIHALYIAKLLKPTGLVYAFEPCPENYQVLEKNINHNRRAVAEIIPIRRAVGSESGVAGFALGATDGTHHLAGADETPAFRVEITTLDKFWLETQQRPALILADVEGQEMSLLHGAQRLIQECKPKFILEHHGSVRQVQVTGWLTKMGYRVTEIGSRHLDAEMES